MIPDKPNRPQVTTPRAPDAILAELWEVKREINRAAKYRIDDLVRMAHESAERVRQQWRQESLKSKENGKNGRNVI